MIAGTFLHHPPLVWLLLLLFLLRCGPPAGGSSFAAAASFAAGSFVVSHSGSNRFCCWRQAQQQWWRQKKKNSGAGSCIASSLVYCSYHPFLHRPRPCTTSSLPFSVPNDNDDYDDDFVDDGEWWKPEEDDEEEVGVTYSSSSARGDMDIDTGSGSGSGSSPDDDRAILESIFRKPSAAATPGASFLHLIHGKRREMDDDDDDDERSRFSLMSDSDRTGTSSKDDDRPKKTEVTAALPDGGGAGGSSNGGNGVDFWRSALRRLAELSLEDYEWRSGLFKANEADRMIELSMARMRGQDPLYVRPMDAPRSLSSSSDDSQEQDPSDGSDSDKSLGPLGRWEKAAVEWLSSVFEEEGRRARTIVSQDGQMVRPLEAQSLGPLGFLEKAVVDFLNRIRASERERVRTNTLRPKDLTEKNRGPLGELEQEAVRILEQIEASEALRAQQIKSRGGEMVRPIDVPGPLGDLEMAVSELFQAEKMRSNERKMKGGKVVRPKDAKYRGPLGDAEYQAYEAIRQLNREEMNRLESIQRYLEDNRPMEANRESIWGILEAVVVGILRAPQLLISVWARVAELLQAEPVSELDQGMLNSRRDRSLPQNPTKDDTTT